VNISKNNNSVKIIKTILGENLTKITKKPFLIEIGVEELPAEPLLKELPNIGKKWEEILKKFNFETKFEFFFTPRRFVLWHREFAEKQPDTEVEMFGAPLSIAYKNGEPTKATESFAKKCNTTIENLSKIEKNGKEVLYFVKKETGKNITDVLEEMLNSFLKSLNFGKSMRWGMGEFEFIRPIHSVVTMLGDHNIPVSIFGVTSEPFTFGHRNSDISKDGLKLTHTGDYFCQLPKHGVIVTQKERQREIELAVRNIEREQNISVDLDSDLLDEVVAITEKPTVLIGTFDEEFLELPNEVIITSMKSHQRYFAVFNQDKTKLLNKFIVVSNSLTDDFSEVVSGNERVLRARLSDALFFYKNDLKRGLKLDGLESLLFIKGLGSMLEKVEREKFIAEKLFDYLNLDASKENLLKAVNLSKADLMSEMVYEFTELQGLMGGYYADKLGESKDISVAISEQYMPSGDSDNLPSTQFSATVALSYKLDLLFSLFSIGQIPTGSRDPFGLRRAVVGIIRIVNEFDFDLDLDSIISMLSENYKTFDTSSLKEFFFERIINFYEIHHKINVSITRSVLNTKETNLSKIDKKIKSVNEFIQRADFEENLSTFKRVANILKDIDIFNVKKSVNIDLFEESKPEEKILFEEVQKLKNSNFNSYFEQLESLFSVKKYLDNFFDNVIVNAENIEVKENRQAILIELYQLFLQVSDIKEISIR
jgi:glycyl-tRNA synthetase beta chain